VAGARARGLSGSSRPRGSATSVSPPKAHRRRRQTRSRTCSTRSVSRGHRCSHSRRGRLRRCSWP